MSSASPPEVEPGPGDCVVYALKNPSFEKKGGWKRYKRRFAYTEDTASHGHRSIVVSHGGAKQFLQVPAG